MSITFRGNIRGDFPIFKKNGRKVEYVLSKVRREQKTKILKPRFPWVEKNGSVG